MAFVATRLAFVFWVRPNLFVGLDQACAGIDPRSTGFGSRDGGPMTLMPEPPNLPNAWIHSVEVVDTAGKPMTATALDTMCPGVGAPPKPGAGTRSAGPVPDDVKRTFDQCLARVSAKYHTVTSYHPSGRYWPLQWLELGIYVGAAALLAGLCIWWVRRRLR